MRKETTPDRDFASREAKTRRTMLTYRRNMEMMMSERFKITDTSSPRGPHIQNPSKKTKRKWQRLDTSRWQK
jgi:hypothetical protein